METDVPYALYYVEIFDDAKSITYGQPSRVLGPFEIREQAEQIARRDKYAIITATASGGYGSTDPSVEERSLLRYTRRDQLDSVCFNLEGIQLRFNGSILSVYTQPSISLDRIILRWSDDNFKNVLCGLVGHFVIGVKKSNDEDLRLLFDSAATLIIPLKGASRRGPEAVMFTANPTLFKEWWVL
jgi:hypothetical protein